MVWSPVGVSVEILAALFPSTILQCSWEAAEVGPSSWIPAAYVEGQGGGHGSWCQPRPDLAVFILGNETMCARFLPVSPFPSLTLPLK